MQRNFAARKVIARAHTVCLEGLHGPRPLLRLPLARQQLGFRIEGGGDRVSHSLSLSLSLSPPPRLRRLQCRVVVHDRHSSITAKSQVDLANGCSRTRARVEMTTLFAVNGRVPALEVRREELAAGSLLHDVWTRGVLHSCITHSLTSSFTGASTRDPWRWNSLDASCCATEHTHARAVSVFPAPTAQASANPTFRVEIQIVA